MALYLEFIYYCCIFDIFFHHLISRPYDIFERPWIPWWCFMGYVGSEDMPVISQSSCCYFSTKILPYILKMVKSFLVFCPVLSIFSYSSTHVIWTPKKISFSFHYRSSNCLAFKSGEADDCVWIVLIYCMCAFKVILEINMRRLCSFSKLLQVVFCCTSPRNIHVIFELFLPSFLGLGHSQFY